LYPITEAIGPVGVPVTVGTEPVGCCAMTLFTSDNVNIIERFIIKINSNPNHLAITDFIGLQYFNFYKI
jgi:hypothetical protein